MKSILLKLEDDFFEDLEEYVKEEKVSKTAFIKNSIIAYKKSLKSKRIEAQLARESLLVRKDSMEINKQFDSTLNDGLDDY